MSFRLSSVMTRRFSINWMENGISKASRAILQMKGGNRWERRSSRWLDNGLLISAVSDIMWDKVEGLKGALYQ